MDCELDMLGATDFEKAVLMDAAIKQQQAARQASGSSSNSSKPSAQASASSSLATSIAIMVGLLAVGAVAAVFGKKQ